MAEHGYGHLRRGRCDCVEGECAGSGRRDGMARTTTPPRIRSSTTCKVAKVVALAFSEGKHATCDVCRFYVSCASLPGRAHIGILTAKRLPRLHKGQVRVAKGGGGGRCLAVLRFSRLCVFCLSLCRGHGVHYGCPEPALLFTPRLSFAISECTHTTAWRSARATCSRVS